MSYTKIALASIKYHKRVMVLYFLFLLFTFFVLFTINSLKTILPILLVKTEDLLYSYGLSSEKQAIITHLKQINLQTSHFYSFLQKTSLLFTGIGLFIFYTVYQRIKQREFSTWQQTGSSLKGWLTFNLIELLLPLFVLGVVLIIFYILFQQPICNFLLTKHIQTLEQTEIVKHSLFEVGDNALNQLVIRIPNSSQAWISSFLLSTYEWSKILLSAFWLTTKMFVAMILSLGTMVVSYTIFWRSRSWKKHLPK